jgi:hypothetical protein
LGETAESFHLNGIRFVFSRRVGMDLDLGPRNEKVDEAKHQWLRSEGSKISWCK